MGAVGESNIVGREALLGDRGRGDNEDRVGAKMEEEKRAITISNSSEGTVEGILEQIKVTYEGERWRAWREVLPVLWEQ